MKNALVQQMLPGNEPYPFLSKGMTCAFGGEKEVGGP